MWVMVGCMVLGMGSFEEWTYVGNRVFIALFA